ncbi:MAG: DUF2656 family protein [Cyanobacteria bacterium P01_H01_bin.15]
MNVTASGRMLISYNFDVDPAQLPPLSSSEFVAALQQGLSSEPEITCQPLEHPHWLAEIQFPLSQFAPPRIGELCVSAIANQRSSNKSAPVTLALGGIKTTPATSPNPAALQEGNWGVDLVETVSKDIFFLKVNWTTLIAGKSPDQIFEAEYSITN